MLFRSRKCIFDDFTKQEVSQYLEVIAKLANINKPLHYYMSRSTFIHLLVVKSVPIELIQKMLGNQGNDAPTYNLMVSVDRTNGNPRLCLFDIESGAELELSLSIENQQAGDLTTIVCLGNALTPMIQEKNEMHAIGIKYRGLVPVQMNILHESGEVLSEVFTEMEKSNDYGANLPALIRLIGLELIERRSAINAHPHTKWDK